MIEEEEKLYIANKYGNGEITTEAADALGKACLLKEETSNVCRAEIFNWCYTFTGEIIIKEVTVSSVPEDTSFTIQNI